MENSAATTRTCDAIVIGGGPAGSAFAIELARYGREAVVLEQTREPHDKVCGEFLSLETQRLLDYLGVGAGDLGATRIETLRLVSNDTSVTIPLPFAAAGLSRRRLDQAMLDAAQAAGATVLRGEHVTSVEQRADGIAVVSNRRVLTGGAAVLASGKHNLRGLPREAGDMVGMKIQLSVSPRESAGLRGIVQLAGYDGGYAGVCHVEDEIVTLCWLVPPNLIKRLGAHWSTHADFLADASPYLRTIIVNAKPLWERPVSIARLPFGYLRRKAIGHAVYAVGDQLAVIPSYTGDGMAIAIGSGVAAARALISGRTADEFQFAQTALLRGQFRMSAAVNLIFKTALRRRIALAAVNAVPAVVPWIVAGTRLRGYEDLVADGAWSSRG